MRTTVDSSSKSIQPDSFCALNDLPHSFVVKVRRRPRRAVALLLLQLSRRRRRVDVVIAAATTASLALLVRAAAAAKELRRLQFTQKGLPCSLPRVRARALAALEALSGDVDIAAAAAAEDGDNEEEKG